MDLSKTRMISFFYRHMMRLWHTETSRLTVYMSDTDSFIFGVEYPVGSERDFYRELAEEGGIGEEIDFSSFSENHPVVIQNPEKKDWILRKMKTSKGVLGLFKSEMPPEEFLTEIVALKPKLYAYRVSDQSQKLTCKGVTKSTREKHMNFETYKRVLDTQLPTRHSMNVIRSKDHQLSILNQTKTSATLFDDKVFWLNKYRSLPHGHYLIPSLRAISHDHDYLD